MIEITERKVQIQAEGTYGTIKLVGNATIKGSNIETITGSIYRTESTANIGSFRYEYNASINVDDKSNVNLLCEASEAVNSFIADVEAKIKEGGI